MQKLDKKTLDKIHALRNAHAVLKNEIADLEILKQEKFSQLLEVRESFKKVEQQITTRFGKDAIVDITTGEIRQKGDKDEPEVSE